MVKQDFTIALEHCLHSMLHQVVGGAESQFKELGFPAFSELRPTSTEYIGQLITARSLTRPVSANVELHRRCGLMHCRQSSSQNKRTATKASRNWGCHRDMETWPQVGQSQ